MTFEELRLCVSNCQKCDLARTRTQTVFGSGNTQTKIMLVGEAPGRNEDLKGEPFVGQAGKLLGKMLQVSGISRDDVFITNMLKCRPPWNRDPEANELEACRPYLNQQIEDIQPKVLVTLGRFASQELSGVYGPMAALLERNDLAFRIGSHTPIFIIPTYHPAYILRNGKSERAKAAVRDTVSRLRRASILASD